MTNAHHRRHRSRRERLPRHLREQGMLVAAGEVFAERGFHGASMDSIASRAGISKPMLYNYFGSKDGLYAAYVGRAGQELLSALREAAPPDGDPRERLAGGVLAFLDHVDRHRASWTILLTESSAGSGPVVERVALVREELSWMLEAALPERPDRSRAAHAHALTGAGEALAQWWLDHPEEPRERIAELFLALVDA